MSVPVGIRAVRKVYPSKAGPVDALGPVDLDIASGRFVSLVGPSGCGKSTLLLMLAGLLDITAGEIDVAGRPVRGPLTDVGIVFQGNVLVDWRDALGNVLLQIEMRGLRRKDYEERARILLGSVGLQDFIHHHPYELSGGMQQRTAFCRALIHDPPLILMDEPLGALDKQLREQMQLEIRQLHQRLGVTMVYVTHDQAEALTLSDRIAVFHRGRIEQLDTPEQMYEYPKNAFVARFIGENNRLDGRLEAAADGRCTIRIAVGDAPIDGTLVEPVPNGGAVTVSLRPERVQIRAAGHTIEGHPGCRLAGSLQEIIYLGDHVRARVALAGNGEFMVKRPISEAHTLPHIGAAVEVFWTPEHCRAFAQET